MGFPLDSKLDNGSTVADWLGTAALAAALAARKLTDVREQSTLDPARDLADAEQCLGRALQEVATVRAYLVRHSIDRAYDSRVDHPERYMSDDVWQV